MTYVPPLEQVLGTCTDLAAVLALLPAASTARRHCDGLTVNEGAHVNEDAYALELITPHYDTVASLPEPFIIAVGASNCVSLNTRIFALMTRSFVLQMMEWTSQAAAPQVCSTP